MEIGVARYFKTIHAEQRPPTICGLALFLGFNSRQSLLNYEGYDEEFLDTIKKAKMKIELFHEEQLCAQKPTGHIFWLKNFGWVDKQEHEHTVTTREYTKKQLLDMLKAEETKTDAIAK